MPGLTDAGTDVSTDVSTAASTDASADDARSLTLIQSLQRGLRLVEVIVDRGPLTARDMSEAIGIGLPTTYHLLRTLVHENFLVRMPGGLYTLGPQLHSAAEREKDASVVRVLRETMTDLRDATAATAVVAEFDGAGAVVTHIANSKKGPRPDLWVGMELPLHATALGKAVLGQLDEDAREAALARAPLESYTWRTGVDPERLRGELLASAVRAADGEFLYGVACLAVPLLVPGRPAAIGVAFSSSFGAKRRRELEQALVAATEALSTAPHGPAAA